VYYSPEGELSQLSRPNPKLPVSSSKHIRPIADDDHQQLLFAFLGKCITAAARIKGGCDKETYSSLVQNAVQAQLAQTLVRYRSFVPNMMNTVDDALEALITAAYELACFLLGQWKRASKAPETRQNMERLIALRALIPKGKPYAVPTEQADSDEYWELSNRLQPTSGMYAAGFGMQFANDGRFNALNHVAFILGQMKNRTHPGLFNVKTAYQVQAGQRSTRTASSFYHYDDHA
jgi:hypothetical protein